MDKMDGKSKDIVAENVGKLKDLFPEAFTEGKVDFDALKQKLGEFVDDRDEHYSFTWNGKSRARTLAQTPSTGTLRPCKDESLDWDTTQNIFIEGDNLEVLKLLYDSYENKIKMIYIDPPYNTGNDFVYKDNFKDNIKNYKAITGQVDGKGRNLSSNPETSGRYHTDWLNMVYPRLILSRELLRDDGVIFISIDDNEVDNLKKICSEIFGEENFVGLFVREAIKGGSQSRFFRQTHDYILVYGKSINNLIFSGFKKEKMILNHKDGNGPYAKGRELNKWGAGSRREDSPSLWYPIKGPNGEDVFPIRNDGSEGRWRFGKSTMQKLLKEGNAIFEKRENGTWIVYEKLRGNKTHVKQFISILKDKYLNAKATEELKTLFEKERAIFDFSKPSILLKDLTLLSNPYNDGIVLDFFAGSSATAHAVMQLNAEDGGTREFIMVQLPETTDKKSEAFNAGYKTIAEISKERIRRAAAKIKEENPDYKGDLGFKVFKLDSTNIKSWEVDSSLDEKQMEAFVESIKLGRSDEDVLYEMLLKYGLDLTLPIVERTIERQKVFDIGGGTLLICLSDSIDHHVASGIAKLKDKFNLETKWVVFKDSGFVDDAAKTNTFQILKQACIPDIKSL